MEERLCCFYENCKESPEFSCKCSQEEILSCNLHMSLHLSKSVSHKIESLYEKPNPQAKEAVLDLLRNEKKATEESIKAALNKISEHSKQAELNFEETLKSLDPCLIQLENLINLVSSTEKIPKNEQNMLIKSLASSQQEAFQLYKNLIPQTPNFDNTIKFFCTFDVEKMISQLVENKIKAMINKRANPIENRLNKFDAKINLVEKNCEKKINEAVLKYDRKIGEIENYTVSDRYFVGDAIEKNKEKIEQLNSEYLKWKKGVEGQLKELEAKNLTVLDAKIKSLKDDFSAELKNTIQTQLKECEMKNLATIDSKINDLKDRLSAELKNIPHGLGPQAKSSSAIINTLTPNRKIELECEELDNFEKKIGNIINCQKKTESINKDIANMTIEEAQLSKVNLEYANKQAIQDYAQTNLNYGTNADYIQLFEYSGEIRSKYKKFFKSFIPYAEKYKKALFCFENYHQEINKFKCRVDKIRDLEIKIDNICQSYYEISQEDFQNLSKEVKNLNESIEKECRLVNKEYNENLDYKSLIENCPEIQKHFNEYCQIKIDADDEFESFTYSNFGKINEEINKLKGQLNICSQFKSQIAAQTISCSTALFSNEIAGLKVIYEGITKEYKENTSGYENDKNLKHLFDVCIQLKEVYQAYIQEYSNVSKVYNQMISIPESSRFLYAVSNYSVQEKNNQGYYTSVTKTTYTKINVLNNEKNTWYIKTTEPLSTYTCIALLPDNELFCYGNKNPFSGISCTISIKNNVLGRMLPPGPPCYDSGAIFFNNSVYVFGGKDSSDNKVSLASCFSLTQNSWSRLAPLPVASYLCSCVYFNQKMLIIGYNHSKIYRYNIQNNSYSETSSPNMGSNRSKMLIAGKSKLYLIESGDIYESGILNENTWKRVGYSNIQSFMQVCSGIINESIFIGFFRSDYGYYDNGRDYHYFKFDLSRNAIEKCQEFRL